MTENIQIFKEEKGYRINYLTDNRAIDYDRDMSIGFTANEIFCWLDNLITKFDDSKQKASFCQLFSRKIKKWTEFNDFEEIDQNNFLFVSAFYKGVYLFLSEDDHYRSWDAYSIYFLSVWQWYNIVKDLCEKNQENGSLMKELNEAFRILVKLLKDRSFNTAIADLSSKTQPMVAELRERLRIGLVLQNQNNPSWASDAICKGCGLFENVNWQSTRIHPVFQRKEYRVAIRQTISQWALPRYDYDSALHLVYLLKNGFHRISSEKRQPAFIATIINNISKRFMLFHILLLFIFSFSVVAITSQITTVSYVPFSIPIVPIIVELVLIIFAPIIWARIFIDSSIISYLIMPRLLTGIFVGYLALILEGSSIIISQMFVYNLVVLILLIFTIIIICYWYIYNDIYPRMNKQAETNKRTITTICLSIFLSAIVGLPLVAITTAVYDTCSFPYGFGCFLGPFGWVDFGLYITFVPLALITGLISQFIFEDKTITEPVWSNDQQ